MREGDQLHWVSYWKALIGAKTLQVLTAGPAGGLGTSSSPEQGVLGAPCLGEGTVPIQGP